MTTMESTTTTTTGAAAPFTTLDESMIENLTIEKGDIINSSGSDSNCCLSPVNVAQHNRENMRTMIYDTSTSSNNGNEDEQDELQHSKSFEFGSMMGRDNDGMMNYYRVSYRGVIALLSKPDLLSPKSGVYVSYGEIIATSHPILKIVQHLPNPPSSKNKSTYRPPISPHNNDNDNPHRFDDNTSFASSMINDSEEEPILCIRVDDVLTGGYALDEHSNLHNPITTSNSNDEEEQHYGYIFSHMLQKTTNTNTNMVASSNALNQKKKKKKLLIQSLTRLPPMLQSGHFFYKIVANTPLPLLAGPSIDAPPLTRAVLLPNTIHEICMRIGTVGLNNLQDGVIFLRLAYKRGWVADRRILLPQTNTNNNVTGSRTILLMKEVTDRIDCNNHNLILSNNNPDDTSIGASTISSATSSISSFASAAHKRNKIRRQRRKRVPMDIRGTTNASSSTKHNHHLRSKSSSSSPTTKQPVQKFTNNSNKNNRNNKNMSSPTKSDVSMMTDVTSSMPIIMDNKYRNHPSSSVATSSTASTTATRSNTTTTSFSSSSTSYRSTSNHGSSTFINTKTTRTPKYFLMLVLAPKGLKILDAPHFQVNHLIRGQQHQHSRMKHSNSHNNNNHNRNSSIASPSSPSSNASKNSTSIFHTMAGSLKNHNTTHNQYQIYNNHSKLNQHNKTYSNVNHVNDNNYSSCSTSWEFDATGRTRILPHGALFEASKRMETASVYTSGAGLIKLADNTGWAIVPKKEELEAQFYHHNDNNTDNNHTDAGTTTTLSSKSKNTNIILPYKEVGVANIETYDYHNNNKESAQTIPCRWLRIINQNGVNVFCPPSSSLYNNSYNGDSNSNSLSSSFVAQSPSSLSATSTFSASNLGAVSSKSYESHDRAFSYNNNSGGTNSNNNSNISSKFLSPLKQQQQLYQDDYHNHKYSAVQKSTLKKPFHPKLPCGLCVEVEDWDPTNSKNSNNSNESIQSFVRLRGGQGWIPRMINDEIYAVEVKAPNVRYGSFWFRVKSEEGIRVRQGPCRLANFIKSEHDNKYFRFECGEFLRASEILQVSSSHLVDDSIRNKNNNDTDIDKSGIGRKKIWEEEQCYSVCFAKLFRNINHHHSRKCLEDNDNNEEFMSPVSIHDLSSPGEWVQVSGSDGETFLESCSDPPVIKRHHDGWCYNVVVDIGLQVYKGPSFYSGVATKHNNNYNNQNNNGMVILRFGEKILVNEVVRAFGDDVSWLRLKDGRGWVYNYDKDGNPVVIEMTARLSDRKNSNNKQVRRSRKGGNSEGTSILETSSRFSSVIDSQYNGIISRLFQTDAKS